MWRAARLIVRASWTTTAVPDGAVVGAHEAGDVLGVVVGADHDVAGLAAAARCRPRCAARPARPGSARRGSRRRSRAASRREAGEPGRARAQLDLLAQQREGAAPESKRSTVGRAARAGAPSASSSTNGRLSVATSATRTSAEHDLHRRARVPRQLSRKRLWRVDSAAWQQQGTQGPAQRDRRLVPPPGEAGVAHARRARS